MNWECLRNFICDVFITLSQMLLIYFPVINFCVHLCFCISIAEASLSFLASVLDKGFASVSVLLQCIQCVGCVTCSTNVDVLVFVS